MPRIFGRACGYSGPLESSVAHITFFFCLFTLLAKFGIIDIGLGPQPLDSSPTASQQHEHSSHCNCERSADSVAQDFYSSSVLPIGVPQMPSADTDSNQGVGTGAGLASSVASETPARLARRLLDPSETTVAQAALSSDDGATRRLGGGSACGQEENDHPTDALLFLFNAIIIGTVILHLTTLPKFHHLQQSVTLFVVGIVYSLVQEGLKLRQHLGPLGHAYDMWMDIDPHLILFAFLPPLLAEDAMQIDTNVARRVASQCIFLAGPGVLTNAFATALFLYVYLPYGWSFLLCLTLGAVLAATDPVAVVSLLKELGASPTLTIQIQGESLLNDGTAIVLYMLAYDMLKGKTYDASAMTQFLVVTALCAIGLGWLMGNVFCFWIRKASLRLEHNASLVQVALTLCCAYWTFIIAEGVLHISGVLCTVAASLVLADRMWSSIVDKHTTLHIWHMFGYLGNTLIFFVAGALTGHVMVYIEWWDYVHLIVLYIACMLIRLVFFFATRPILTWLSIDGRVVTRADALVMSWGGLRGAVGLALAIQVSVDRAGGTLSPKEANRVLFYTGGIAALTLIINATSCPSLVRWLGITQSSEGKMRMLMRMSNQLSHVTDEASSGTARRVLREMLEEVMTHIFDEYQSSNGGNVLFQVKAKTVGMLSNSGTTSMSGGGFGMKWMSSKKSTDGEVERLSPAVPVQEAEMTGGTRVPIVVEIVASDAGPKPNVAKSGSDKTSNGKTSLASRASNMRESVRVWLVQYDAEIAKGALLVEALQEAKNKFMKIKDHNLNVLRDVADMPMIDQEEHLSELAGTGLPDNQLMHAVNQAFLSLVNCEYWERIEAGEFVDGTNHAVMLLTSISAAIPNASSGLLDFQYLLQELEIHEDLENELYHIEPSKMRNRGSTGSNAVDTYVENNIASHGMKSKLLKVITSLQFNVVTITVIVLNLIYLVIEDRARNASTRSTVWLICESLFTVAFLVEFVLKVLALRWHYWLSGWNVFDFVLVITGLVGVIFETMVFIEADDVGHRDNVSAGKELSEEARLIRFNRVFRVLRIVRVMRIVRIAGIIRKVLKKMDISLELVEQLRVVTLLTTFANAHVNSQKQFMHYFGRNGKFNTCEEARCILTSQTYVYKAIAIAVEEARKLDEVTVSGINILREAYGAAEDLTLFVCRAHETGVILAQEAESILEGVRDHRRIWEKQLKSMFTGHRDLVSTISGLTSVPSQTSRQPNSSISRSFNSQESLLDQCINEGPRGETNTKSHELVPFKPSASSKDWVVESCDSEGQFMSLVPVGDPVKLFDSGEHSTCKTESETVAAESENRSSSKDDGSFVLAAGSMPGQIKAA